MTCALAPRLAIAEGDGLSVRIAGTPSEALELHAILERQLKVPVQSRRLDPERLAEQVSQSDRGPLRVWVELSEAGPTRVFFTQGGEIVSQRQVPRDGATTEVHFEELALVIRTAVEALGSEADRRAALPTPQPKEAGSSKQRRSPSPSAASKPAPRERQQAPVRRPTPWRFDIEPHYAASRYLGGDGPLWGLGVAFEAVHQRSLLAPGVRLSSDATTAFELSSQEHLTTRILATFGLDRGFPSRWGAGISSRAFIKAGDEREIHRALLLTGMAELRLGLGDRVDGVFGILFDAQIKERQYEGEPNTSDLPPLRLAAYLGVAITALGER
ncbi:MAG: hypothetical protein KIT72_03275 [Polyangiaceae bacterium]|nr:hypothetical protein [Polyangiaceae bacterium]MCW5789422.1 hypothetical protein [Polyangiaceae bacterium]